MALITRLARLFRADFHAVLDRMEPPDIVLRQAVRDMQENLDLGHSRLNAIRSQAGVLAARIEQADSDFEQIEADVDACFYEGDSGMVRVLLRRRLEAENHRQHLQARVTGLEQAEAALMKSIGEQQASLQEIRQKAAVFECRESPAIDDVYPGANTIPGSVSEEDVDVALFREQQKRRRT